MFYLILFFYCEICGLNYFNRQYIVYIYIKGMGNIRRYKGEIGVLEKVEVDGSQVVFEIELVLVVVYGFWFCRC